MGKLVAFLDGKVAGEYTLDKERIRIGRKPHNEVTLNHPTVSGEHALVTTIRQDSFLEDLNSTNGTRVNQKPVKKCALADGDEIRIGKFVLKYFAEPAGGDRFEEPTRAAGQINPLTGESMDEGAHGGEVEDHLAETQYMTTLLQRDESLSKRSGTGEEEAGGPAALRILSGPGTGSELLLERALTTLGKPGVQVAVITRRDNGYFFTHVEGDDFPLINGRSAGGHSHPLKPHDIIELAETKMEFFYK